MAASAAWTRPWREKRRPARLPRCECSDGLCSRSSSPGRPRLSRAISSASASPSTPRPSTPTSRTWRRRPMCWASRAAPSPPMMRPGTSFACSAKPCRRWRMGWRCWKPRLTGGRGSPSPGCCARGSAGATARRSPRRICASPGMRAARPPPASARPSSTAPPTSSSPTTSGASPCVSTASPSSSPAWATSRRCPPIWSAPAGRPSRAPTAPAPFTTPSRPIPACGTAPSASRRCSPARPSRWSATRTGRAKRRASVASWCARWKARRRWKRSSSPARWTWWRASWACRSSRPAP
jgi:hypothetical protein